MDHELFKAKKIAEYLVQRMQPACYKIEIAGSIRRRKSLVHDIEIVAEPYVDALPNLFGDATAYHSRLDDVLADLLEEGVIHDFPGAKNGQRLKQFHALDANGIKVDLFIVRPPAQWGSIFTIRTGPAHYSHWLVSARRQGGAMPSYMQHRDGGLYEGDRLIETPSEDSFFEALGIWPVPKPWEREPQWRRGGES